VTDLPPVVAAPNSNWAATAEFYALIPWADSSTTVKGFDAVTTLNPSEIFGEQLQSAFAMRASIEYKRVGLLADVSYSQLGAQQSFNTSSGLLSGNSTVSTINGIYDLALRYRFGSREAAVGVPGEFTLIPYAGVRLVEAQLVVEAQLQNLRQFIKQGNLSRTWAEPLIGLQGSVFLAPRLRAFGRFDLAGFGLAGEQDLSGNAQLGFGYAVGNNTSLNISMRYFGQTWNNGARLDNGYTSHQYGPEVAVKFFF